MLILTRNQNESIVIDDDIKITILGTKGQDVKIGIEAPEAQMVEVSKTISNIFSLWLVSPYNSSYGVTCLISMDSR